MTFPDAIKKLERHISVVNHAIVGTAVIEAILVILIGIVSNNLNTDNTEVNKICIWLLMFFGLLYLFLLFIKTLYNKTFPGSITNELKYERGLNELKKDSERQKTINDFLVLVIRGLNSQTCSLNYVGDTHLCDSGIKDGIYNLIQPVIDKVDFILDTTNTQFTIGIYLDSYCSLTTPDTNEKGILIIKDALIKGNLLNKDLLDQNDVRDEQFQIQIAIKECINNSRFVKKDYSFSSSNFSIICSPIYLACNEEETNGALFIISREISKIPNDLEINLKIFNSVIANWIYRYNECVSSRLGQTQYRIES